VIQWLLFTLAGCYLLAVEPHIKKQRAWLAEHWSFYRGMISCTPCSCAWPGAWAEVFVHEHLFVPPWLAARLPEHYTCALAPVLAFLAALAIGYVLEILSPLFAMIAIRRMNGAE
jgi:hypothetical protein